MINVVPSEFKGAVRGKRCVGAGMGFHDDVAVNPTAGELRRLVAE